MLKKNINIYTDRELTDFATTPQSFSSGYSISIKERE